ncbi:hypothetical protein [Promicromonospora iranensis]|uniref:Mycofactocin n=1 Tax=Promicromonospora iranensis TaxID=1105144 RepID=A0ABU2CRD3_9MICO|nr:hypothetical protein [Promicromonospora iranensis]MDR7383907.1 hypothetical protein [Promicromonospora iranensis]
MTSSNAIADPASAVGSPAEKTPEAVDGAPATTSPFELLPAGESFGVCDLDGVCS